jgi:hypothetical protein
MEFVKEKIIGEERIRAAFWSKEAMDEVDLGIC